MADRGLGPRDFRRSLASVDAAASLDSERGDALPPPTCSSARDSEILIAPWLEELIRQYEARAPAPARSRRLAVIAMALAIISGALSPVLLRWDRAAYPSELDKQEALELCGRTDPTFVRFLARERAACYERFLGLAGQAAANSRFFVVPAQSAPRW